MVLLVLGDIDLCRSFKLIICVFSLLIAAKILPVVRKQHLLLCTLLICNAAAMEVNVIDVSFG